ncbi:hypothetical protein B566_EDAN018936 [Ephemera danica]|nr:hypothetical protein B566_EDAN018936 [Ephemera danica]
MRCYEVTALPWYQRKIASSIFGSLPTSSYEEALEFCLQAEAVSPNDTPNLILMGKIYNKLDQREKAIEVLKRVRDYPQAVKEEDIEAKREATKMLRDLGVTK